MWQVLDVSIMNTSSWSSTVYKGIHLLQCYCNKTKELDWHRTLNPKLCTQTTTPVLHLQISGRKMQKFRISLVVTSLSKAILPSNTPYVPLHCLHNNAHIPSTYRQGCVSIPLQQRRHAMWHATNLISNQKRHNNRVRLDVLRSGLPLCKP